MVNLYSKNNFANRLKEARKAKDLTQEAVGKLSGIPTAAISHFEVGRRAPSLENLHRLADALGVSVDYLLGRKVAADLAGPKFEKVFRAFESLSESDRKEVTNFIDFLAQKKRKQGRPRK